MESDSLIIYSLILFVEGKKKFANALTLAVIVVKFP